jgi:hypothetical protein
MRTIINIDDVAEKMQSSEKITFGSVDFIANRFGDLHLQEPESPVEEEQPPPICAFFAGLEEVVDVRPRALAQHLNHYGHDIFTKLGRKSDLKAIL